MVVFLICELHWFSEMRLDDCAKLPGLAGTGDISCAGSRHGTVSSDPRSVVVCVGVLGLVLIARSPILAENGLKVGADGPDVGTDGVAPSSVHSGVTEPSGTRSESSGTVAEVDTEVALACYWRMD